jgi:hypothetical protein
MSVTQLLVEGPAPDALKFTYRNSIIPTVFSTRQGWCPRCNEALNTHWWQVVDPAELEQAGVVDCAVLS